MTKLDDIKASQGYTTNVRNCGNCAHLKFDTILPDWMLERNATGEGVYFEGGQYTLEKHGVEKNFRCGIGNFKIKKTASCNRWTEKHANPNLPPVDKS